MPQFKSERTLNVLGIRAFLKIVFGVSDMESSAQRKQGAQVSAPSAQTDQHGKTISGEASQSSDQVDPHALPDPNPNADRIAIFKSLLAHLAPGRLLDLGAGHGKFSVAAKELGWQVTAVDARTARMPMSDGIEWIESDVRDFDLSGYDCICVLGLLYHLTVEDQLALLKKCAGTLTIVDTHVGSRAKVTEYGYDGTLFKEVPNATAEVRNATPTASWGNELSFWPTQESLLRMAQDVGFSQTATILPPHTKNRTFYVFYP